MTDAPTIAAVIIGRNEGERLIGCLASVRGVARVVYVDSGSTDGSVAAARAAGAEVVELDLSRRFTAARARNAGIEALRREPAPDYIQFIDGDCELRPAWLTGASAFLLANTKVAIVCGRRRERFPEASVYNRLCDREWNTPIGKTRACGGDSLIRMDALDEVAGFDPNLIAGEEPELCVRLRAKGWEIWRLDFEMTLHDAAISRFSQWWKRTRRGGHAAAQAMAMHGEAPERQGVAQVRRALVWALFLPIAILLAAVLISPWALFLAVAYPAQIVRLAVRFGAGTRAWEEAFFMTLGKVAELHGIFEYWFRRLFARPSKIMEYS